MKFFYKLIIMRTYVLYIYTLLSVFLPAESHHHRHHHRHLHHKSVNLNHNKVPPLGKRFNNKLQFLKQFMKVSSRIIGGENVTSIADYPYMAFLRSYKVDVAESWCTGTILNEKFVLTAAHCLINCSETTKDYIAQGYLMEIYVGATMPKQAVVAKVKKFFIHPLYECYDFIYQCESNHDIGIVELRSPLKFNKKISKVRLSPPFFLNTKHGLKKAKCQVLGWGLTKVDINRGFPIAHTDRILQVLNVSFIDNKECLRYLNISNTNETKYEDKGLCKATQICTINLDHKGFCEGDSGGPLICKGIQVGVSSLTVNDDCVGPNMPDLYSRVDINIKWIKNITSKYIN